jgi:phosphatidylserine/phosphatidylglycerophosphate/cardiolipin synthase-like enzyme
MSIVLPTSSDIMTLKEPDGIFATLIRSVLHLLALRSKSAQSPIVVRIMFGNYPAQPVDCTEFIKTLTNHLPKNANLHIWVGAWRCGLTWNHAKFIAVDGRYLHTGGHNMWELPYLKRNPIHDLSVEMEGSVARDAHLFADQQWKFVKDRQSTFMGAIVDKLPDNLPLLTHTRVTVSEWPTKAANTFPPFFHERTGIIPNLNHVKMNVNIDVQRVYSASSSQSVLEGFELKCEFSDTESNIVPVISIGRQGSMVSRTRPSDDAILAMINASQQNLALVIQDLGPVCITGTTRAVPGLNWPKDYLTAIGNAIYERGVDVEIILSNPRSAPGGTDRKEGLRIATPYGNGWDCVDVACEIIRAIQRAHTSVDDTKLRAMITDNLRVCFIRHNKSSTYSDGNSIGLHTKHFIVDGRCCYIGSQNLYDSDLAEWGVVIDDADEVRKIQEEYFVPMWRNSFTGLDVDVQRVMDGLRVNRDN